MGVIGKTFAIIMFPLSIIIFLENIGALSIEFIIDKAIIGAILMIILQVITLGMLKMNSGEIKIMNIFTAFAFIIPAAYYIMSQFVSLPAIAFLPMVIAVMMFVEAMYALH